MQVKEDKDDKNSDDPYGAEDDPEEYINQEKMLDIAEKCFVRIA